jgi:CheY-like chemotaxis protein
VYTNRHHNGMSGQHIWLLMTPSTARQLLIDQLEHWSMIVTTFTSMSELITALDVVSPQPSSTGSPSMAGRSSHSSSLNGTTNGTTKDNEHNKDHHSDHHNHHVINKQSPLGESLKSQLPMMLLLPSRSLSADNISPTTMIRSKYSKSQLPIVLMGAYSERSTIARRDVNAFVTITPLKPAQLFRAIRTAAHLESPKHGAHHAAAAAAAGGGEIGGTGTSTHSGLATSSTATTIAASSSSPMLLASSLLISSSSSISSTSSLSLPSSPLSIVSASSSPSTSSPPSSAASTPVVIDRRIGRRPTPRGGGGVTKPNTETKSLATTIEDPTHQSKDGTTTATVATSSTTPTTAAATTTSQVPSIRPLRILVAEDNLINQKVMEIFRLLIIKCWMIVNG